MLRAVISLGTNSTRLLVVRAEGDAALHELEHRSVGTRLGEGLQDAGSLSEAAMQRSLAVVATYAERIRLADAHAVAIATSALRRAHNGAEFAARFAAVSGLELRILDGAEEAAATFAGATYGAPPERRIAMLDVGGGSTECAAGFPGRLESAVSVELGAVRLGERFPDLLGSASPAHAAADAQSARTVARERLAPLAALAAGGLSEVRAVAGTPLTLGAIVYASDVERVSGCVLTRAMLEETLARLLALDLTQRRALPGMLAQRADILPAGALIVSEALGRLGVTQVRLERNDLLLGYLLQTR
jgi:exopolyphosphatase/guanosine-5'-triphosphate,3'-diphosphate pyrophosphatase